MSRNPSFAIVLEGGLVQSIIVKDWPSHMPLPQIAVVNFDTEGATDDEITHFSIGDKPAEAVCHCPVPEVYECFAITLSPRKVLTALGETFDNEDIESPLAVALGVRQRILDLDAHLNQLEKPPTGDEYNELFVLANDGLIDVLKALGDPADFGA
ncbi:hypothetical protein [Sodalis sp. RH22]|uniref:hypothetical protein n=1 Tax=unclassified Sodalis (in: enterobacteria) TaxID=2636512 RepID=UPI0039B3FECC